MICGVQEAAQNTEYPTAPECVSQGLFVALLSAPATPSSPLQCLVLLNVLPVLVQGGGTDALQLTPRQGWLDEVGDVQAAATTTTAAHGASANQCVHLIDPAHEPAEAPPSEYSKEVVLLKTIKGAKT